MISDASENITSITWTVYGKIGTITKNGNNISYTYDAGGNRITKTADGKTTLYVRDASGNVMSLYEIPANDQITQKEVHLYGSSRLGMALPESKAAVPVILTGGFSDGGLRTLVRGEKIFELSNHLGNVLVTLSDKKIQVAKASPNQTQIDYYTADVVSASDYAPFGMGLVGRNFSSDKYRYGFNGKEKNNEVYGEGNAYDFEARIQDPRLGRFLSIDPRSSDFVSLSPYVYAANNPIALIDKDGEGPEDPPGHIVTAIKAYSQNFYSALYHANNTSNNQLYLWAIGKSNDPNAYYKVKGAVGEAIFKERANNLAAIGVSKKGPYVGVSSYHYLGGKHTHLGITYQVDVQTKVWTGGVKKILGLPSFTVQAGIPHNKFDGTSGGIAKYGSSWKNATYTLNYEVKSLSPANDVEYNYRHIMEGIQQTLDRGQGKHAIGILVVDKKTWMQVANDTKYGSLLKEGYNRLTKKDSDGERNYLKLEVGLAGEAERGAYGLRDTVNKAEQEQTEKSKKKN